MSWIRRNLRFVLPAMLAGLALVAYLAFGVFGVHTLFIDDRVDEDGPVFASGAGVDTTAATPAPVDDDVNDSVNGPGPASETPPTTVEPVATIVTLAEGSFVPLGRYSGEGTARVLNDGSEQRFLRFENFATDNGPDLNVYLVASDASADPDTFDDDAVDLGNLKGNIGDQNYEIPPDVDLSIYDTVVVWCVRFSTPFTAADLVAA
jgi:Electron transfer DM13